MACQQTKPGQPHWHLLVSLPHQVHKRGKIVIFVEDIAAAIAPVQDMINKTTARSSGCSWHSSSLTPTNLPLGERQKMNYLPRGIVGRIRISYLARVSERSSRLLSSIISFFGTMTPIG